jgi:hypothetical protein
MTRLSFILALQIKIRTLYLNRYSINEYEKNNGFTEIKIF